MTISSWDPPETVNCVVDAEERASRSLCRLKRGTFSQRTDSKKRKEKEKARQVALRPTVL